MKKVFVMIALATAVSLSIAVPVAFADNIIYQATGFDGKNGLNFGPDSTPNPPTGGGYWEMGNTVTFAGSAGSYTLGTGSVNLYGGGDVSYPIEMQIYSGSNPNTGTLLASAIAPAGYAINTATFDFNGVVVPDTITYILSLPDQNGTYDSIYLYPIMTSGTSPTVGSGPNSLWYGTPGNFVANDAYAIADGAGTNYLQVKFAATPEPSSLLLLGTGFLGLSGFIFWRAKKNRQQPCSISA